MFCSGTMLFITSSGLMFCSGTILSMIVVLIHYLILFDVLLWYHAFYDSCTYSLPHLVWCFFSGTMLSMILYLFITSPGLMFFYGTMHSMIVVLIQNLIFLSAVLLWYHAFHDSCTYYLIFCLLFYSGTMPSMIFVLIHYVILSVFCSGTMLSITSSGLMFCFGTILFMIVVLIHHLILFDVLLWNHAFHGSCTYSLPHLVWCFSRVPCFPWYCTYSLPLLVWCFSLVPCVLW